MFSRLVRPDCTTATSRSALSWRQVRAADSSSVVRRSSSWSPEIRRRSAAVRRISSPRPVSYGSRNCWSREQRVAPHAGLLVDQAGEDVTRGERGGVDPVDDLVAGVDLTLECPGDEQQRHEGKRLP